MKQPFELLAILLVTFAGFHPAYAADDVTPLDITFKRQAVGRFTFDEGSAIPLSGFTPNQVVNLTTEYPQIPITRESCRYTIDGSLLRVTSEKTAGFISNVDIFFIVPPLQPKKVLLFT